MRQRMIVTASEAVTETMSVVSSSDSHQAKDLRNIGPTFVYNDDYSDICMSEILYRTTLQAMH